MAAAAALSGAGAGRRRRAGAPVKLQPLPKLVPVKRHKRPPRVDAFTKDVLTKVELEADSGGRPSYMPYDKLHFPRITRDAGTDGAAEVRTMWMVGFLDHEDDTGPSGPEVAAVREYEVSSATGVACWHGAGSSRPLPRSDGSGSWER